MDKKTTIRASLVVAIAFFMQFFDVARSISLFRLWPMRSVPTWCA